jgi:hypothetical protein
MRAVRGEDAYDEGDPSIGSGKRLIEYGTGSHHVRGGQ